MRIVPFFIPHHGCLHECVFCNQHRTAGVPEGSDPLSVLSSQISSHLTQVATRGEGAAQIAFYGGSFTALPVERQGQLLEAAKPFLGLGPLNSIRVSTRPDCIDEAAVKRLKQSGVRTIELGAQSMCDEVLDLARRGHTSAHVSLAAAVIKAAGLSLILQMMTGLPGDTPEKSLDTARRFVELMPDGVRVFPTVIVRGTELHEMWLRGEYAEHKVEDAVALCAEILAIFESAGVPVIRVGLNPTDALSAGGAVAGAYHPALGELVYSRLYYERAVRLLDGVTPGSDVTLSVPRGRTSIMTGQRRQNIKALTDRFALNSLKVVESDIEHIVLGFRFH
jgi:histone acetyltransferase (RNA polymerase elongator complex component)